MIFETLKCTLKRGLKDIILKHHCDFKKVPWKARTVISGDTDMVRWKSCWIEYQVLWKKYYSRIPRNSKSKPKFLPNNSTLFVIFPKIPEILDSPRTSWRPSWDVLGRLEDSCWNKDALNRLDIKYLVLHQCPKLL